MANVVKKKVKKGAKKSFYTVEAPLTSVPIALYGSSAEEFEGRVVKLDLTKSLRGKGLELRMKVVVEDGKLIAEPITAILSGSFIRKSVRRGTDYVEDSFKVKCKDAVVFVKPFLLTRRRVSRAVRKALREEARKYLEEYVKIRSVREMFSDIMANKVQKGLAVRLKKVYPLAMSEIRAFGIVEKSENEEDN